MQHFMGRQSLLIGTTLLLLLAGAYSLQQSVLSRPQAQTLQRLKPKLDIPLAQTPGRQTVVVAGGCFWGVEAVFEKLGGVSSVVSGYAGGDGSTANYAAVSTGTTGHAESVQITYDPQKISLGQLLQVFFVVAHDPTQVDRQEPDHGTQYRSAIFFANSEQQQVAQAYINQLNQSQAFSQPIATKLVPLTNFYPAESYHQNFIDRNPSYPYVVVHDLPKIAQLQKKFPELLKH